MSENRAVLNTHHGMRKLTVSLEPIIISCSDGVLLSGHYWSSGFAPNGTVIINPATGVLATYYHRYAEFLSRHGFDAITYDYRGIGASRSEQSLRSSHILWRDWGELDFDAAVRFALTRKAAQPLCVVGHSIGGVLPGLAQGGSEIARMLTVGAQYAYWRDYPASSFWNQVCKWHLLMPLITAVVGYFPGKKFGWLEDLPAGVVYEWSLRRAEIEGSFLPEERDRIRRRFASSKARILAVGVTDDDFASSRGIARALAYFTGSDRLQVQLAPQDFGQQRVGHFGAFHSRHEFGFWLDTLLWLRDRCNAWPERTLEAPDPHANLWNGYRRPPTL